MPFRVLITDYAWPNLEIEKQIIEEAGGELVVAETGDEGELLQLAPQVSAILTNWKQVTPAVLDAAPSCRIVSRYGVGLDNIAVDHATSLGIAVTNVPDFCIEELADHAFALLLACARRIVHFSRQTAAGTWDLASGRPMNRLRGKTLGLIGLGNMASGMVARANGFGIKVIAHARTPRGNISDVEYVANLEEFLKRADFVSLHIPLTSETRHLVDGPFLSQMKPTAYLINTARGGVIDEKALEQALKEMWIAGAALDVLDGEPPDPNHPLLKLPTCIVTPHAAFYSSESIAEVETKAARHVAQVMSGMQPDNLRNPAILGQDECRLFEWNAA